MSESPAAYQTREWGTDPPIVAQTASEHAAQNLGNYITHQLHAAGLLSGKRVRLRFDTFDVQRQPGAYALVHQWTRLTCVHDHLTDGGWLWLDGPNGLGKTHLALSTLAALVTVWGLDHYPYPTGLYLDWTWASAGYDSWDKLRDKALAVPALVIDDLTKRGATRWSMEQLYELVNTRDMHDLTTVFTSNVALDSLFEWWIDTARQSDKRAVASAATAIIGRIQHRLFDPRPDTPPTWAVRFAGADYRTTPLP